TNQQGIDDRADALSSFTASELTLLLFDPNTSSKSETLKLITESDFERPFYEHRIHRDGTPMKCTETEVIIDGHRQVEVTFDHLERNHLVLGNNLSADVIQDLSQMFPCVS